MVLYFSILAILITLTTAHVVHDETAELNNDVRDHEFIESPSLIRLSRDTVQLNTKAFGQEYTINLKRSSNIFSDNFQFLTLEKGNDNQLKLKQLNQNIPQPEIYKDEVHGSVLHISDINGNLKAVCVQKPEGLLTPDLSITPHSNDQHKIVKREAIYHQKKILNSILKSPSAFSTAKSRRETPSVVNLRYATLKEPTIQLSVVGAIIIGSPDQQPYMEKARFVSLRKNYIECMDALGYFAMYQFSNPEKFPNHDILMVMSGEKLATKDEDGSADTTLAGIAIVGGACTTDNENNMTLSSGIAEDTPPFYSGVLHHAHEIAHLLGSVHDGDEPAEHLPGSPGAENCPFKDGYLMSYKRGTSNNIKWSQCTVDQINWYLGTSQAQCLFTKENTKTPMKLNHILPGTLVSIDNQCQYAGRNARAYPTQDLFSVCVVLYCISDTSSVTTQGPALDGTPCGYLGNRWCINGQCIRQEDL
uniref:Peptidase M12B domain-containing protein n=1 Tax=Strigamia maritima TaxID=126957 RepID=T1J061_STRMM